MTSSSIYENKLYVNKEYVKYLIQEANKFQKISWKSRELLEKEIENLFAYFNHLLRS